MTSGAARGHVRAGLLWSALNSSVLRLGGLVTGVVLARILAPEAFGAMAIALTVQTVLMTMSELGLAADMVRHGDFEERGPTFATMSVVSSAALTVVVWACAPQIAGFLGSDSAVSVVRAMSLTLLLASAALVPYARLMRAMRQRTLFAIELVAFVISTSVAISLALAGWGALSIALGQVCAMTAVVILEYLATRTRPVFGWNREAARGGLTFGLPLALAGLLSLVLMSLDNAMVGHLRGVRTLGLYALAFNVSSWPTSVIGMAIRSVAMPAFARRSDSGGALDADGLAHATTLAWAVAVPISACLGLLAHPLIQLLYGAAWAPAATVLTWLAALGAVRILTEVWVAYLTAAGRSGLLLGCQAVWLVALALTFSWAIPAHGLVGTGAGHVGVALLVAVPVYLLALKRASVKVGSLVRTLALPVVAIVPALAVGILATADLSLPVLRLLVGGSVVLAVYAALMGPRIVRLAVGGGPHRPTSDTLALEQETV